MERISSHTPSRPLYGVAAVRALEARAQAGVPPHTLMQRAGDAVARLALALAPHARRIWIVAGPGNNGGDGLEAAFRLRQAGHAAAVRLLAAPDALPEDARASYARARAAGVAFDAKAEALDARDLAIDALLGIGASRSPQGPLADAVRTLNALPCPVLAVDVPSGLDAGTGQPLGSDCVRARHTLTLLALKPGLFTGAGRDHAGTVWLDVLGIDATVAGARDGHVEGGAGLGAGAPSAQPDAWLHGHDPAAAQPRAHAAHKGTFGDLAVVGGAPGLVGAALLAARAALAAGAGRVYVELAGQAPGAFDLDPVRPELMFRPGWTDASTPQLVGGTTVVCGCGGGDAVRAMLPRLFSLAGRLVLDADALNATAADAGLRRALAQRGARSARTVLTPHPLEAARLLDTTTAAVQVDRLAAARELAARYATVVVLKGSGSVVAAPEAVPAINATGNAALATAGTGDVLAGWIGGLWAQAPETSALEIAIRGTAEHGAAAEPAGVGPLRAADLVEVLYARRASATRVPL
jgi:hydroxyethylthiazole kinase-like uncharacterized protein yjeF